MNLLIECGNGEPRDILFDLFLAKPFLLRPVKYRVRIIKPHVCPL